MKPATLASCLFIASVNVMGATGSTAVSLASVAVGSQCECQNTSVAVSAVGTPRGRTSTLLSIGAASWKRALSANDTQGPEEDDGGGEYRPKEMASTWGWVELPAAIWTLICLALVPVIAQCNLPFWARHLAVAGACCGLGALATSNNVFTAHTRKREINTFVIIDLFCGVLTAFTTFWIYYLCVLAMRVDAARKAGEKMGEGNGGLRGLQSVGGTESRSNDTQPLLNQMTELVTRMTTENSPPDDFLTCQIPALLQKSQTLKFELSALTAWCRFWWYFGRGLAFLGLALPAISVSVMGVLDSDIAGLKELIKTMKKSECGSLTGQQASECTVHWDKEKLLTEHSAKIIVMFFSFMTIIVSAITKGIGPDEHYGTYESQRKAKESEFSNFQKTISSSITGGTQGTQSNGGVE